MPSLETRISTLEQSRSPKPLTAIFRTVVDPETGGTPLTRMACNGRIWSIREGESESEFKQRAANEVSSMGVQVPRFIQTEGEQHAKS